MKESKMWEEAILAFTHSTIADNLEPVDYCKTLDLLVKEHSYALMREEREEKQVNEGV